MAEMSSLRNDSNVDTNAAAAASANANASTECDNPPNASTGNDQSVADANDLAASDTSSEADSNMILSEEAKLLFQMVARQVEYYFSTTNLQRDTYVSTLRSLNDGYVPLSIIANFGKVRSMVPYDSINAVKQAAAEFSELLEIVEIDTATGKKVLPGQDAPDQTLEAVGPVSGKPIPASSLSATTTPATTPLAPRTTVTPSAAATPTTPPTNAGATPSSSVQNTIILREAPDDVTEEQIRNLFAFDKSPPIKNIHPDVANCWFVTLDTTSRDDMLTVMMELRSKEYPNGSRVQSRLKSAPSAVAVLPDPVVIPVAPSLAPMQQSVGVMYPLQPQANVPFVNGASNDRSKNSKKKRSNNVGKGSSNGANGINHNQSGNGRGRNGNAGTRRRQQHQSPNSANNGTVPGINGRQSKGTLSVNDDSQAKDPNQQRPTRQGKSKSVESPVPPALGEEQFPALQHTDSDGSKRSSKNGPSMATVVASTEKVEVEKIPGNGAKNDGAVRCGKNGKETPEGDDASSVDDADVNKMNHSDGASTATTSSSSSSKPMLQAHAVSNPPVMGGYAAALMKAAPPKSAVSSAPKKEDKTATQKKNISTGSSDKSAPAATRTNDRNQSGGSARRHTERGRRVTRKDSEDRSSRADRGRQSQNGADKASKGASEKTAVVVTPPAWGRGRSFADVLKKEEVSEPSASTAGKAEAAS